LIHPPTVRRRRGAAARWRWRRRVGGRRGELGRRCASAAGAVACAYHGGSSLNFGRARRAVVEKVSDQSANVIGSVVPKSTTQVVCQCTESVRQTKGQSANIPTPRRCERTRVSSDRRAGERSVGNGFWLEDVLPHVGVGSLTTLRRTRAGAGSSAECVRFGEKGRCTCGLRQRRRTRENSSERAYETTGTYPEPHQVSEMSSLWPNGRKWAREFGKIDPYLRYKD